MWKFRYYHRNFFQYFSLATESIITDLDRRKASDKMSGKGLRENFNYLIIHNKQYYKLTALNKLERSRRLKDELADLFKKTKGKIAYEEMA